MFLRKKGWIVVFLIAYLTINVGIVSGVVYLNEENGHSYEMVNQPGVDWDTARTAAESKILAGTQIHGSLATVTSQEEHTFLLTTFGGSLTYKWLGGHQDAAASNTVNDDWRWVTGEPWEYTNWGVGEPNNGYYGTDLGYEDALAYLDGAWNDVASAYPYSGYIVEYPPEPDMVELTELFQTINNEGWNQTAVDSANAILSNKGHDAVYWQTFFTGFFSQHPFSNNLSGYLGYPVFSWFDDEVHSNLQNGLSNPLEHNIIRITVNNPNLGVAFNNDPLLFQSFVNSNKMLDRICQNQVVNSTVKQGVYTFYRDYILTYPQYYDSSVTIDSSTYRFLSVARVQVFFSFKDALPLTPALKEEIANTLNLQEKHRDIFIKHSILVCDNNGLDDIQLAFIDRYSSEIPQELHNLGSITINDFTGNNGNLVWYTTTPSINTFSDKIGSYPENQFPEDISPGISEIFCSALAHEFNHIVDSYSISTNPARDARKHELIDSAGTNHMNYLRSMIDDGYFYNTRQEFFASIANQWFCNSSHVLDLGIIRFNNGYTDPINQFLFFADIYSNGGNTTLFYKIDRNGTIERTAIPISRNSKGFINSIIVNNTLYSFVLDTQGKVVEIHDSNLQITVPNDGKIWKQGTVHTINWKYIGDSESMVKIQLLKGGMVNRVINYSTPIGTDGSGSYSWKIAYNQAPGSDYKIRVISTSDSTMRDTSDTTITIRAGAPITVTVPNGGQSWKRGTNQIIRWKYTGNPGKYVKIQLLKNGVVNSIITQKTPIGTAGTGSYKWLIPSMQTAGSDYKIRVISTNDTTKRDVSNNIFTIRV